MDQNQDSILTVASKPISLRLVLALDGYGTVPYNRFMAIETPGTARLEARLPGDVHALLKRAAEIQGRTLTDFVVSAARDAAHKALEETEIIRVAMEDQRILAEAILNPPKPTPALRRAFRRRKKLLGE